MEVIRVVAAIIVKGNEVLATQRGYGEFKCCWEFPGGKVENNESKEDALIREIKEELNITIDVKEHLCDIDYQYPAFRLQMQCFIATIKYGQIELIEHKAIKWLASDKLDSLNWLKADIEVVEYIKRYLSRKENRT